MSNRRILVANYDYPPAASVGGARWVTMKKYLERLGYEVTVVTTSAFGCLPEDEAWNVVRTRDLVSSPALRRLLRRPELSPVEGGPSLERPPPALISKVIVPDVYALTWVPPAIVAIRRLLRERRFDALVTSSPKDSTHLIGLASRSKIAWVADFRDGWVTESTHPPFPTVPQRALNRQLEAATIRRADVVVAVTEELATDFQTRFGIPVSCVTNGWDPELVDASAELARSSRLGLERQRPVRIAYTGTLTDVDQVVTDRYPPVFLQALEIFARSYPQEEGRVEFVIAGRLSARDVRVLDRFAHLGSVRHLGYLPRAAALAIQRSADALLLVTGESTAASLKLFEYLGAGRPVLHLGRPGAASRILAETGAGLTLGTDDPLPIVEQLRRLAEGNFAPRFRKTNLDTYSYPHAASNMAETIERAIRVGASRSI